MHLETTWFIRALAAHEQGDGHIYDYGIKFLRVHYEKFNAANMHKLEPYSVNYIPNPFRFQYDLTMFVWLNYHNIINEELEILKQNPKEYEAEIFQITQTGTLYGITREDFLFAAAELRWPTTILANGSMHGKFIRDPWSERRVRALGHPTIKYDFLFGGGGQGKTLVSLAFGLMIFDYYLFTHKGARCMISTVSKDKLNSAAWSYLCGLNSSTEEGVSLTAGKAKIGGEWTLTRPKNKDKAGVFKGILIGNQINDQNIIDKLTGSHGHPFIMYIMDEMQSTPNSPIIASSNYTMHSRDFRIVGSGNYGENTDTLAKNIKPDNGWDSVDQNTGEWISTTECGTKAIVLHFNNECSPGMTDEGALQWPHLPNRKKLDRNYPDKARRNMNNIGYRRFWIGYRLEDAGEQVVISDSIIKENLAHTPLELTSLLHTFFSFDSAQAERDRNLQVIFNEGICKITKQRVFGPVNIYPLAKSTESIKYYRESANQILKNAKDNNIISGGGIVDWTGRPAQAEILQENNFEVMKLIYNMAPPDGIRRNPITNRIDRKIYLNIELDFKQDVPIQDICAHHVSENMISLAAWSLRQYVLAGRMRNLNESLLKYLNENRSMEEELYSRKYRYKASTKYGTRFHLEPKEDFKEQYGFSPDLLDCLCQGALYMLLVRHLPLTAIGNDAKLHEDPEMEDKTFHEDLWKEDDLSEIGV